MPVHVCESCAALFGTLLGLKVDPSTSLIQTCGACLGALQNLTEHCEAVSRCVAGLPYLDCPQAALVPSVPRAVSYTFAAAAASLAAANGTPLVGVVPIELMGAVKDQVTTRLVRALGESKCNGVTLELGRVDGNNTIVVEADVHIMFQRPGLDPSIAFHAKRATAEQTLEAARQSGSPLAAAISKLSAELQSNKAAAVVTWDFITREIVPSAEASHHAVALDVTAWRTPACSIWRTHWC